MCSLCLYQGHLPITTLSASSMRLGFWHLLLLEIKNCFVLSPSLGLLTVAVITRKEDEEEEKEKKGKLSDRPLSNLIMSLSFRHVLISRLIRQSCVLKTTI